MSKKITLLIASLAFLSGSNVIWGQQSVLLPEYQNEQVAPRRGNANGTPGFITTPGNVNNEFGAGETATISGGNISIPHGGQISKNKVAAIQIGSEYSQNIVLQSWNSKGYASGWANVTCWGTPLSGCITGTAPYYNTGSYAASWLAGTPSSPNGSFYANANEGFVTTSDYINTNLFPASTRTMSYSGSGHTDPFTNQTTSKQWQLKIYNGHNNVAKMAVFLSSTDDTVGNTKWRVYNSGGTYTDVWDDRYYPGLAGYATFYFGEDKASEAPYASTSIVSSANNIVFPAPSGGSSVGRVDNYVDDGVPLLQVSGDFIQKQDDYNNSGNTSSKYSSRTNDNPSGNAFANSIYLNNYKRPTTVALESSTLDSIIIKDLKWWYDRYDARLLDPDQAIEFSTSTRGCCHVDNLVAITQNLKFVKNVQTGGSIATNTGVTVDGTSVQGDNLLDAAVQIVAGAQVCIKKDIQDLTTTPGTEEASDGNNTAGARTDAMLVVPGTGHNFALWVGRDFKRMNMYHETTSPTANAQYSYTNFPTTKADDVYLYQGASALPWRASSSVYNSANYITQIIFPNPSTTTTSSILGVYTSYDTNNAKVHTLSGAAGLNNPGVIEIGPNTAGLNNLYIYSGGILKNFYSCNNAGWFTINMINHSPQFTINSTSPVTILNDGTSCVAALNFGTAGVNSLKQGVLNATSTGDLLVHAHGGQVELSDNIDFDAITSTQNTNIAVLSDKSYIKTKDFGYTAAGADGNRGHLTLWAQGTPADLSGCGGYISMAGAVSVVSTQTSNAWANPKIALGTNYNYANLVNSGGCSTTSPLTVYSTNVLSKGVQTRIQSEKDSVRMGGIFDYTGQDGSLFVQGERNVEFANVAKIDFMTNTGTGDAVIQSKNRAVKFFNDFQFIGNQVTDLMIDGETEVSFLNGGTIDLTQHGTATAHVGIQSNNGNVLFDGAPFLFQMKNTGNVEVWAGKDIRIEGALTYNDQGTTPMHVHFYSTYDIWTNKACQNPGAPVNFSVTNTTTDNTKTDWIAGRNIHTKDTVNFNYSSTGNEVRDLTLKALGGNIEMDRWTNISYDSDNTILLSAEMDCATARYNSSSTTTSGNQGYAANGTGGNRNNLDGHIFLNDSFLITRTNPTVGETTISAKHHIRTAMVTMDDQASTGNNTTIKSLMGDLFLGYSSEQDNCQNPAQTTNVAYDLNRFVYTANAANLNGMLKIHAGYDDLTNTNRDGGGNIYFTHIDATMAKTGNHPAEIKIPFSNEYYCGSTWSTGMLHERLNPSHANSMKHYEHAGIIGGVGRCGIENTPADYTPSQGPGTGNPTAATDTSLIYRANNGRLLVDAGTRGNIIMNRGTYMDFQNDKANAFFLTRYGDIDMRYPTHVENLMGSVLFLANSEVPNKLNVTPCGCDEQRNNVYLQDFQFRIDNGEGSVFIGADNNIKLQYGGLRNIGTQRDPFLSQDVQYPCGSGKYHCDSDTAANKARELILDFNKAATSGNGGFAAVSSDLIDVYKNLVYNGGASGKGMSSVPTYGSLHGEAVAGYGLYIKTQANKKNWNKTDHELNSNPNPLIGAACEDDTCTASYLHNTARVTFHADARLHAENQKVLIASPVLETFGNAEYNTQLNKGNKTSILIQADSLIYHDSLIIDGPRTQFTTWSNLQRDMPIIRLGHQRFTPPTAETGCKPCYVHSKGANGLDTVFVTFRNDASVKRLHTLVAEHAVISFLTDSFDHKRGNPTINAKFYTDIFKIRNHVELFNTPDHTRDGHFELISEEQMQSKDYAGIYSRQLHMEPIAPTCSNFAYSQLWLQDPALDVITSSTFGGFGWLQADVHVEIEGNLFPGYASLQQDGNCYEQKAGILKMKDLRLDKGAYLKFSVGDNASPFVETYDCLKTAESINIGQYADCLDVDSLTIYGSVNLELVIRPEGLVLSPGESRCFPVIRYKSVQEGVLNHLKMKKFELTSKDHKSIDGKYYLTIDVDTACNMVYICLATIPNPVILRPVTIPTVSGVTIVSPAPGTHQVKSSGNFKFTLKFDTELPLKVLTGRIINGQPEELFGTKNANGEYVYTLNYITGPIQLAIGPDFASTNPNANEAIDETLVWSHNNTLYIKVDREDVASIYSVAGQLVKLIELSGGETSAIPMERGVYIVTLNDGSVHKVIIK